MDSTDEVPENTPPPSDATIDDAPHRVKAELGEGVPLRFYPGPYDEQPVGPWGETRAAMRTEMLQRLERLRGDVQNSCGNGLVNDGEAVGLLLRIHREQCALMGLGVAHVQAF